jgi:hypothetical protein
MPSPFRDSADEAFVPTESASDRRVTLPDGREARIKTWEDSCSPFCGGLETMGRHGRNYCTNYGVAIRKLTGLPGNWVRCEACHTASPSRRDTMEKRAKRLRAGAAREKRKAHSILGKD